VGYENVCIRPIIYGFDWLSDLLDSK